MHPLPVAALVVACVAALAPTAAPQLVIEEFMIPRAGAFPHDPAVGLDGAVWYTDTLLSRVGRLDPTTGAFVDYPTPTPGSRPHGITVTPDGSVWYTAQGSGRLGRVDPATGRITEVVLPATASSPHTPLAHQGVIWFTDEGNATYGRFDPATGQARVYSAPTGSKPYGIAAAPDGALWIAFFGTDKIGRVDTATGNLTLFTVPHPGALPRRIAVGREGSVFYTDHARGYLGRFDPGTQKFEEWRVPGGGPYGIAVGSDGLVWFHDVGGNQMIAFDPKTKSMSPLAVPTAGATVRHMVCDFERGELWLALSGTARIGRVRLGAPVRYFGSACPGLGGYPALSVSGVPRIGEPVTFSVANTRATGGALFLGGSKTGWNGVALPFDLAAIGFPGCFVNSSWDLGALRSPITPVQVPVPVDPSLGGVVVYAQWALVGDPTVSVLTTTGSAQLRIIGL